MKSLEAEALFAEKIMEQVRKLDSTENLTGHENIVSGNFKKLN